MTTNFLCDSTEKVNTLTEVVNKMQYNTGLFADDSTENTLTGRVKLLEEHVLTTDPKETHLSRMKVEHGLEVKDGKFETEFAPMGNCVNREVMLQNPEDPEIWEAVGSVAFEENVGI